jgi:hypothetical protein
MLGTPNQSLATLVVVTSQTCGHCVRYKQEVSAKLIDSLKAYSNERRSNKLGGVDLVQIDLTNTSPSNNVILDRYHQDLKTLIKWFPMFLLFTSQSWKNTTGKLEGIIYNGSLQGGEWRPTGKSPIDEVNIVDWVKNSVDRNSIFAKETQSTIRQSLTRQPQIIQTPIVSGNNAGYMNILPPPSQNTSGGREKKSNQVKYKYGKPLEEENTEHRTW